MVPDHSVPPTEVYSENVTDEVIASYAEQGYTLAFAEEVMSYDLSQTLPQVSVPLEITYLSWTPERTHEFFTVYEASFQERPGFPGWNEAMWVDWTSGDPAFRPDLSVLAVVEGQVVGFITNANYENTQHGYIIQVGVHPDWRGRRLGAALTGHALHMWQEAGKEVVILHVNINNPGAIHLYQQLGFEVIRRRGKFARQTM